MPKHQEVTTAARLAALIAGGLLCGRAAADPDLWGHLTFGRDILATHRIPSVDPYSFTQDVPWVNHEWLSEVLFAAVYRLGGMWGLIVLKAIIVAFSLWCIWRTLEPVDRNRRWWLLVFPAFALTPAVVTFRPQLWTVLFLSIMIRWRRAAGSAWWLVPIFMAWANLHGGWVVGMATAAAWLAGDLLDRRQVRPVLARAAALAVAVAGTVVNPYGTGLWTFLASTVRMTREITEWRPLWQQADPSHAVLWGIATTLLVAALTRRWSRISWSALLPAAGLCIAALLVDRLGPLFVIVSVPVWADAWGAIEDAVAKAPFGGATQAGPAWLVDLAVVAVVWAVSAGSAARCLPITGSWAPDLVAAGALAHSRPGRLVLPFDWGEYAIWHWGPRLRVSMDGRRETVYSQRTLDEQDAVAEGADGAIEYLRAERPEYVWLKRGPDALAGLLVGSGYRIDVFTPESFIAVRADLPLLVPSTPMPGCFP